MFAGEVIFTGVTSVATDHLRPRDRLTETEETVRGVIVRGRVADGVATLEMQNQTGPGDADEFTVEVHHAGVEKRIRPSLSRTFRRAVGLYPRPQDLD